MPNESKHAASVGSACVYNEIVLWRTHDRRNGNVHELLRVYPNSQITKWTINGAFHTLALENISPESPALHFFLPSHRFLLLSPPPFSSCSIIYSQVGVWSQQSAPCSLPQIKMWQKRTVGALIMWTGILRGPGNAVQLTNAWLMMKASGRQLGVPDAREARGNPTLGSGRHLVLHID